VSQLGQLLRETRIRQKLSLDELQELTKIRKGYLEAIEDGNYRLMPGSFYVKAFIRSYAEALGIDPNEALKMYNMEAAPEPETEMVAEPKLRGRRGSTKNTEKWSRFASTILVVSFIVLILAIIYYYYYQNSGRNSTTPDDPNRITDSTPGPNASGAPSAVPTPTPVPTPEPTPTPTPASVKSVGQQAGNDTYEVTNSDKLTIKVLITGKSSWMSVQSADAAGKKTTLYTGELKKDETMTWEADPTAFVRLGAASNVELTVNDYPIPVGDTPNVRNFKFVLVKP